jgi:hypothetical protein
MTLKSTYVISILWNLFQITPPSKHPVFISLYIVLFSLGFVLHVYGYLKLYMKPLKRVLVCHIVELLCYWGYLGALLLTTDDTMSTVEVTITSALKVFLIIGWMKRLKDPPMVHEWRIESEISEPLPVYSKDDLPPYAV